MLQGPQGFVPKSNGAQGASLLHGCCAPTQSQCMESHPPIWVSQTQSTPVEVTRIVLERFSRSYMPILMVISLEGVYTVITLQMEVWDALVPFSSRVPHFIVWPFHTSRIQYAT